MDKTWVKVAFQWGPVAAIVFFLLFQSAGWIPSIAGEVKESLAQHETAGQAATKSMAEVLQTLVKSQQEATRLQRLACLREAKTEADRRDCLQ